MFSRFEKRAMSFLLAGLVSVSGWQAGGLQAHAQDDDTATVQASSELVGEDSDANQDEGFFQIYEPEETPKVMDEAPAGAESAREMYPEEETSEASHVTETFQAEEELTDLGEITEREWYTLSDDGEYYTFKPQTTGLYVLEGDGPWIYLESTVSGEVASRGRSVYYLEQGSTYRLRAYNRNVFRIVAYDDLDTITTGMRVSGQENDRVYRFIPDSDGFYVLDSVGRLQSIAYCSSDVAFNPVGAEFEYCDDLLDVTKGQECLIVVYSSEEGLEIKKCTDKGEANEGVEYGGQGSGYAVYTFAPDTPGYYFVTGAIEDIIGDVSARLRVDVRYNDAYFIRIAESGQARIFVDESEKLQITALDSAPEATLNSEVKSYGVKVYRYTALESGMYSLEVPSGSSAIFYKVIGDELAKAPKVVSMEQGDSVLIVASGQNSSDSYLQWSLKKKESKGTLKLGEVYSVSSDEYYEFTPTDNVYCVSYGVFELYDENWKPSGRVQLEKEKTYYVTSSRDGQGKLCLSDATKIQMELGTKYTVFYGEDLSFTPTETGFYTFNVSDNVRWWNIRSSEGTNYDGNQPFYLKLGEEYKVSLGGFEDNYMLAEAEFRKVEPETLEEGEWYTFSQDRNEYYTFRPQKTGLYVLEGDYDRFFLKDDVSEDSVSRGGPVYYLDQSNTYTLRIRWFSGEKMSIRIVSYDDLATITTGDRVLRQENEKAPVYRFIPESDGIYKVENIGAKPTIFRSSGATLDAVDASFTTQYNYLFLDVTKGQECLILLGYGADGFEIKKCTEKEAQEGVEYGGQGSGYAVYTFAPDTPGYYFVTGAIENISGAVSGTSVGVQENDAWLIQIAESGQVRIIVDDSEKLQITALDRAPEVTLNSEVESYGVKLYRYTALESGMYGLEVPSGSGVTFCKVREGWLEKGSKTIFLEQGESVLILADGQNSSDSYLQWSLKKKESKGTLKLGEVYSVSSDEYYVFAPTDDVNCVRYGAFELYDEDWNQVSSYYGSPIPLEKEKTYYVTSSRGGQGKLCLSDEAKTKMELGTKYTVFYGEDLSFTPTETGFYTFNVSDNVSRWSIWSSEDTYYYSNRPLCLKFGEEYKVSLSGFEDTYIPAEVEVRKAEPETLEEGKWYTYSEDSNGYYFKPEKTGYYVIEGIDCDRIQLENTSREESISRGGPVFRLEQDSTYVLPFKGYGERTFRIVAYENLDEITAGTQISGQDEDRIYRFIPDSDGVYFLSVMSNIVHSSIQNPQAYYANSVDAQFRNSVGFLDVVQGQECLILLNRYASSLEIKKCTDKGEANEGVEYGGQGSGYAVYTFAPDTPGYYFVTGAIEDIIGDVSARLRVDVRYNDAYFIRIAESGQARIFVDESEKLQITALDHAPEATLNNGVESQGVKVYQYTAEESGVYGLEVPSRSGVNFYKVIGDRLEKGSKTISLNQGESILILADGQNGSDSYLPWTLKKKVGKGTLELDKVYSMSSDEYYEFTPTDDVNCVSYGAFEIYDEKWNQELPYYGEIRLEKEKTYYVTSSRSGQGKLCLSDAANTQMELGTKYTVFDGEGLSFTPTETGFYTFNVSDNAKWWRIRYSGDSYDQYDDQPFCLKRGEEYVVGLSDFEDTYMPAEVEFRKVEPETLEEGIWHTFSKDSNGYSFKPEKTGYYVIEGIDCDRIQLENTSREENISRGGPVFRLEQDSTYVLPFKGYRETSFRIVAYENLDEITAGKRVSGQDKGRIYRFIPDSDGVYMLDIGWGSQAYCNSAATLDSADALFCQSNGLLDVTKGQECLIVAAAADSPKINKCTDKGEATEGVEYGIQGSGYEVYRYTAKEPGVYSLELSYYTFYVSFYKVVGNGFEKVSELISLGEGEKLLIVTENSSDSDLQWVLKKKENKGSLELGKVYSLSSGDYYEFTPAESMELRPYGAFKVYDKDWNEEYVYYDGDISLEEGETYYVTSLRSGQGKLCLSDAAETQMELDKEYQGFEDEVFRFTPAQTGVYTLDVVDNASEEYVKIGPSGSYPWSSEEPLFLKSGTQYNVVLSWLVDDYMPAGIAFHKVEPESLSVGVEKLIPEKDVKKAYVITASETGKYMLSVDGADFYGVYDEDGESVEVSSQREFELNGGKKYYILFRSTQEQASIKLEKLLQSGDYIYKNEPDGTVRIVAYSGAETDVSIPDKLDGKVVSRIGESSFKRNETLQTVSVPAGVTEIQYEAFYNCTELRKVEFSADSTLRTIGDCAFAQSGLAEIVIPDTVEVIGYAAFRGCDLTGIVIPNRVITVGDAAFSRCSQLAEVTLGTGLDEISAFMFCDCSSLKNIVIPDTVEMIGESAFRSCGLTEIVIPDSVTSLENRAFAYNDNLSKAIIGKGIVRIAASVFIGCDLKEVQIQGNVEKVGGYAFAGNKNLKKIVLPKTVTVIEYGAFNSCTQLSDIEIPQTIQRIEEGALSGSTWYENQQDGAVYVHDVLYKYKGTVPENTKIEVKAGTKSISQKAFEGQTGITEVTLPVGLSHVGRYAFNDCSNLKAVHIPFTVTEIEDRAFGHDSWELMEDFVIYGVKGSEAQRYAEDEGITFVEEEQEGASMKGDLNGDQKVNLLDLRMVLRAICGKTTLTGVQEMAADVNGDGKVNLLDLRLVLRFICGKISSL